MIEETSGNLGALGALGLRFNKFAAFFWQLGIEERDLHG